MSLLTAILFMGSLMGSALGDCAADEMDLCDSAPTGAPVTDCAADEMDLCDGPTVTGAPGTTAKPTTTTSVCMSDEMDLCDAGAPTSAPGGTSTTQAVVTGTMSLKLTGVTTGQVETAVKQTLATEFSVAASAVQVTVAKQAARRLSVFEPFMFARRLEDAFSISYRITAAASKLGAMQTRVNAIKADPTTALAQTLKQELKNTGVSDAVANSLKVESFTGDAKSSGASTVPQDTDHANTFKFALALAPVLWTVSSRV